ncbi:MAG: hypothetical protein ATN31_00635 [Candidatus Epulonipiscioides saccharophilum]|nr:MAG: hypothetical protein ATN31_00635 [Epulopiscium sp. AS2M-Bin001]
MKKFMMFTVATIISVGSFGSVMAAAPVTNLATTPTQAVATVPGFVPISFETEVGWTASGPSFTAELVTDQGVFDGTKALKFNITSRQTDWGKLNKLNVNPPEGTVWTIPDGHIMSAMVTNPNDFALQIRWNVSDNKANTRMAYYLIEPGKTKEIIYDTPRFGEPGVANGSWTGDGFGQKGFDEKNIKYTSFYVAEPEIAKVMVGAESISYIIDNIVIKPAPVVAPAPAK